ncbi:hypothetical protein TNCV_2125371 [Trichonephila clavipes]|nr:hypothetical protein TNCV_2125371 [Trichonephila clavipes]
MIFLRPHVGDSFLNGLPGSTQFSSKIMLVRIPKSCSRLPASFQITSMAGPLPDLCPVRARVGSAETADAIVLLCA